MKAHGNVRLMTKGEIILRSATGGERSGGVVAAGGERDERGTQKRLLRKITHTLVVLAKFSVEFDKSPTII